MPYVHPDIRLGLMPRPEHDARNPGELQYQIACLINGFIEGSPGLSYQVINDVLGALDGAGKEFYRRIAVPYEEKKIAENGDVYT